MPRVERNLLCLEDSNLNTHLRVPVWVVAFLSADVGASRNFIQAALACAIASDTL